MTTTAVIASSGEPALIERARAGDADAFQALIEPRLDALYRTAWAIVGNEADARDAARTRASRRGGTCPGCATSTHSMPGWGEC